MRVPTRAGESESLNNRQRSGVLCVQGPAPRACAAILGPLAEQDAAIGCGRPSRMVGTGGCIAHSQRRLMPAGGIGLNASRSYCWRSSPVREMPSFFIRCRSVAGFMPSCAAAPR